MELKTKRVKERVAQIAGQLGELVVECIETEKGIDLGNIEQGMRQMLQAVGREA